MDSLCIRTVEKKDFQAIESLIKGTPRKVPEPSLVAKLREEATHSLSLELVAEGEEGLCAHVLMSPVCVEGSDYEGCLALIPISVAPEIAGQGIGRLLLMEAEQMASDVGYGVMLVIGQEEYYAPFGYQKMKDFGLSVPFGGDERDFMVKELQEGALAGVSGHVLYPAAFFE